MIIYVQQDVKVDNVQIRAPFEVLPMVPLENLPIVPLVAIGTIGTIGTREP